MEKLSQKYTIINLLEEMPEGAEFAASDWPLHVTIVDTYAVDWDNGNLRQKLATLAASCPTVTATGAHDEYFGPAQQTHVTILDMSQELIALHYSVVALLKTAGAVFNDPQYTEAGFRAHITVQPQARIHEGQPVTFNNLTIVDMFPGGDPYQRKVLNIFRLPG